MDTTLLDRLLVVHHKMYILLDKWYSSEYDPEQETEEYRIEEKETYDDLKEEYDYLRQKLEKKPTADVGTQYFPTHAP
jgi:hypothetical protein